MNIKSMEISFWRHKSNIAGKSKLYCRISIAGERAEIGSTGLLIYHDHWDGQQISSNDPQAFFKNDQLDILRTQLRAIFNDLFRKKEKITAAKIKRLYLSGASSVTLAIAFDLYMKDSRADQERDLTENSLTVYDNVRKKLIDFLASEKALDVLVEDFDLVWLKRYRQWMKKRGHADSYVAKHSQTISNMLKWAKLNKIVDNNPLAGLRVKGVKYDDPTFLTNEEFEKLRTHPFENEHVQMAADILVILCRSGFHYGDLEDFVKQYKTAVRQGLDGKPWLIKDRIKTEVKTAVPVFDEVKTIIDKYGGWEKLPLTSLTKFNVWLKVVGAELKLKKKVSSKIGRKTFTDWCFNTIHLSTDAVKVLLGRLTDKGLEVYSRPDERRVIAELEQSKEMKKRSK
ncbi:phage integrase SAM-like domain-containing protein [Spirosoma sp. KUDC1026]|uniref:phage integrase SAM-like domain-containing protein n=1 Tax=Spirosoma sp. KUDC1026 TaxID=2745947 RepID=UPI00159BC050|nr:phage integrase SAM-like domain-containing protein [Spirosoma sp. KUDC1026]QKZ13455.1 phage integrase SAM-like domain-containing protein [Spirosoma sp. KUDC1026]